MVSPVLVIGRSGQVATALRDEAPGRSRRSLVAIGRPRLHLDDSDLAQRLSSLLAEHRPALVINAAAYTAVDRAEQEAGPAMAINADAVGTMARLCGQQAIPLFHLSSDYVFDGSGQRPWLPADRTSPLGVYGASKLQGEILIQQACQTWGTRALILRVSWVFGPQGVNFVNRILQLADSRHELRVVDDQVGGPTSAAAIARALLGLIEPAIANHHPVRGADEPFPWGVHHLQGQPPVSWCAFAQAIVAQARALHLIERSPAVLPISSAEFPAPARRPANSRLDCRTARLELGLSQPVWRQDLCDCLAAIAAAAPPS